ncbi:hypothetical protein HJG60_011837 [Phyllostomus discolor]|uniref:Uncharacterized protein n=1 Tax=Phyllostomus discolor TaxID=89673 RepID=A0A833ZLF8_9CHIR|nr:hypothetical protein HJG60_011837 [Phyllostomus discolor]
MPVSFPVSAGSELMHELPSPRPAQVYRRASNGDNPGHQPVPWWQVNVPGTGTNSGMGFPFLASHVPADTADGGPVQRLPEGCAVLDPPLSRALFPAEVRRALNVMWILEQEHDTSGKARGTQSPELS